MSRRFKAQTCLHSPNYGTAHLADWWHFERKSVSHLGGGFGGFDQFPKLRIFLQRGVLAGLQAGTEQKILERVAAENPVDEHAQFVPFKIDAIITHAKTVQRPPVQFQLAEGVQFGAEGLLGESAEFAEDLQLQFLGHARHLGGAGGSKDDLKHIG